jgi:hypothetical protein
VSAFAVLRDILKPKSFVGLFGAAPSPLRCHAYSYDSPPRLNFRCLGSNMYYGSSSGVTSLLWLGVSGLRWRILKVL